MKREFKNKNFHFTEAGETMTEKVQYCMLYFR